MRPFSPREEQIYQLIVVDGLSVAETAQRLSLGIGTIYTHVKHILWKRKQLNLEELRSAYRVAQRLQAIV